jgi:DNA-directed RNA polymerase subunit N (RpoN/RPB10)
MKKRLIESFFKFQFRLMAEIVACLSCGRQIFSQFREFANKRNFNILKNLVIFSLEIIFHNFRQFFILN